MPTLVKYLAEWAFKLDWQRYRNLPGADPVFIDNAEPNRGLNARSSNYAGNNDYDVHLAVDAVVENGPDESLTTYRALSPAFEINDYAENSVDPPDFDCVITIKDLDGNDITNFLDVSGTVQMVATWTLVNGGNIADYADAWAIHRIEQLRNATYGIFELSSLRTNLSTGNPLQPETGETGTKIVTVGSTLVTTCLIDGSSLTAGGEYKLSARLGMPGTFYDPPTLEITGDTPDPDTGEIEFDIAATPGYGSFIASDTWQVLVYRSDTEALIETLSGNYGDDAGAFATDIAIPANSVVNFLSGAMDESTTITFNKYGWAVQNSLTNEGAVPLRFEYTITQSESGLSASDNAQFDVELLEAEYSGDLRYLATDNRKIYTGNADSGAARVVGLDITLKYSQELFAAPNAAIKGIAVNGDSAFGTPWSKLLFTEGQAGSPFQFLSESDTADGEAWSDSLLKSNFAGADKLPNLVLIDDLRTANGQPVLWAGTEDSSAVAGNFLFMLYYDGAAWQAIDFSAKLLPVQAASAARYTACISKEGDIYGTVDANNPALEHRVFRMQQTSGTKADFADFSVPGNWSNASLMCGAATAGTTDGNGAAASFGELFNLITITEDSNRPLTMWATDGGNDTIRLLTYNGGSDNYDVTTIIGSAGVPGSTNGTGTAARLNDPRGMCRDALNVYIGDYGNRKIRKVVISSLAVTDFSGTGDNAYRLATLY